METVDEKAGHPVDEIADKLKEMFDPDMKYGKSFVNKLNSLISFGSMLACNEEILLLALLENAARHVKIQNETYARMKIEKVITERLTKEQLQSSDA